MLLILLQCNVWMPEAITNQSLVHCHLVVDLPGNHHPLIWCTCVCTVPYTTWYMVHVISCCWEDMSLISPKWYIHIRRWNILIIWTIFISSNIDTFMLLFLSYFVFWFPGLVVYQILSLIKRLVRTLFCNLWLNFHNRKSWDCLRPQRVTLLATSHKIIEIELAKFQNSQWSKVRQVVWWDIWKHTMEKSHSGSTCYQSAI